MAKKLYEESNIQAIADAIREKNGETTTYKPSEMAAAISAITTGGVEVEPIVLTGMNQYSCAGKLAGAYIALYGNTITTKELLSTDNMFNGNTAEKIPFDINFSTNMSNATYTKAQTFYNCKKLKTLPKVSGIMGNCYCFLYGCNSIREIPESWATDIDWSYIHTQTSMMYCRVADFFSYCYSLRTIPEAVLKQIYNAASSNGGPGTMFRDCYVLDEIVGLRASNATVSSNMFSSTFANCHRISRLVFDTDNGTPRVQNWKSQTLDLSSSIGYEYGNNVAAYGGITSDKCISNDTAYQKLKNDPDWYTNKSDYSRYNRISAVETIHSLPDTSAYLASAGGTNTIKFRGSGGAKTDGGAINTLTEEEIAVAAAKGWTVTFA